MWSPRAAAYRDRPMMVVDSAILPRKRRRHGSPLVAIVRERHGDASVTAQRDRCDNKKIKNITVLLDRMFYVQLYSSSRVIDHFFSPDGL